MIAKKPKYSTLSSNLHICGMILCGQRRNDAPLPPEGPFELIAHYIDVSPVEAVEHLKNLQCKPSESPAKLPLDLFKRLGILIFISLSRNWDCSSARYIISDEQERKPTNKRPLSATIAACKLLEDIICAAAHKSSNDQGLRSGGLSETQFKRTKFINMS